MNYGSELNKWTDEFKLKSVGEWQYGIRTYDIAGRKVKPFVNILHKKHHWTDPWTIAKQHKKCQCGEELPALLRVFIMLVDSGYWFADGSTGIGLNE